MGNKQNEEVIYICVGMENLRHMMGKTEITFKEVSGDFPYLVTVGRSVYPYATTGEVQSFLTGLYIGLKKGDKNEE